MNIEYGINPNCSEATLRIDIRDQDRKKVDALIEELQKRLSNESVESEWDDSITQEEWSEGYINEKTIFGIPVVEISGDAPYNFGDEMLKIVKKYLPKAKTEWQE